jgi:hypothetical protein
MFLLYIGTEPKYYTVQQPTRSSMYAVSMSVQAPSRIQSTLSPSSSTLQRLDYRFVPALLSPAFSNAPDKGIFLHVVCT